MANSSLILSSLDFDTLKANFKEYLKAQPIFSDYNFDGSNINVLLDVMSYNSYLNAFYLNMVASEMFLDSAQNYDSVISHAKELNYIPRSTKSSYSEISFSLQTSGITGSLVIPKNTRFTGVNSNGTYVFTTDRTHSYTSPNSIYSVTSLEIYEGAYYQDTFVVNYNIESQKFVLSNQYIDTDSIEVTVIENNGGVTTVFPRARNLYGLTSTSSVHFLQPAQNGLYEITFGDGLFGRKPLNTGVIVVTYRVSSGSDCNGVDSFVLDTDLRNTNGGQITPGAITVNAVSNSGANLESIESIRYTAPRYFATQQRAVSSEDYASLVLANFGGSVSDVVVYGGETLEPKQYGRVIVSIKPSGSTVAPDFLRNEISNYLIDYIVLPNRIIISDPDYFYCYINTTVQYDKTLTTKTTSDLSSGILSSITTYSADNLEKFANDFRYSRMVAAIDNSDTSITSNDTEVRLIKRITPLLNSNAVFSIELNNELYNQKDPINSDEHLSFYGSLYDTHFDHASVISSKFTFNYQDVSYPLSYFEDDSLGNIDVYVPSGEKVIKLLTIGTVDYINGIIKLNNLNLSSYQNYVSIYCKSLNKDLYANQNKIILIESSDVNITMVEKQV